MTVRAPRLIGQAVHDRGAALWRLVVVFCAAALLTVLLQWRAGAFGAELAGNNDEPGHYVTGLMVHDYVARGFPGNPLRFAREFYDHYPKVVMGHWPPVFYVVEAAWMLVFGTGRVSAICLMTAISAAVLTLTWLLAARQFGFTAATGAALVMATTLWFQQFSKMVMTDMLVTLLLIAALIALSRHLDRNEWRTGFLFGAAAAAAVLTKPTAIVLAVIPLPAVILLGRQKALRTAAFWSPAVLVCALALPWFLMAPDALHGSVALFGGLRFRWYRPLESIYHWAKILGPVAGGLAAIGMARTVGRMRTEAASPHHTLWVCMLLVFPAAMALRTWIGAWEVPYLVATLPFLAMFACSGFAWLIRLAPTPGLRTTFAAVLLAVAVTPNLAAISEKPRRGMDRIADFILRDSRAANAPVLVVSDSRGEGAFVAEMAGRERRPGHRVIRASKALADSDWSGTRYRPLILTPDGLMQFLTTESVALIVLDPAATEPHAQLVREAIAACPARLPRFDAAAGRQRIELFRYVPEESCDPADHHL